MKKKTVFFGSTNRYQNLCCERVIFFFRLFMTFFLSIFHLHTHILWILWHWRLYRTGTLIFVYTLNAINDNVWWMLCVNLNLNSSCFFFSISLIWCEIMFFISMIFPYVYLIFSKIKSLWNVCWLHENFEHEPYEISQIWKYPHVFIVVYSILWFFFLLTFIIFIFRKNSYKG